jgi:hypothetical protein
MHAKVGERIVVGGHRASQPDRHCSVLEVRHDSGKPPYLVRWEDSGHEASAPQELTPLSLSHEKK